MKKQFILIFIILVLGGYIYESNIQQNPSKVIQNQIVDMTQFKSDSFEFAKQIMLEQNQLNEDKTPNIIQDSWYIKKYEGCNNNLYLKLSDIYTNHTESKKSSDEEHLVMRINVDRDIISIEKQLE